MLPWANQSKNAYICAAGWDDEHPPLAMNSISHPIDLDFEYPYDATAQELSALRRALATPQVQPYPIIFDNDVFRPFFHTQGQNEHTKQTTLTSIPLPDKDWFNDVYSKYQRGSLKVCMPDDPRVSPHSHTESSMRLFSDVADVRPTGGSWFNFRKLLYNGQQVAWRLFECVVQFYGDQLQLVRLVSFALNCDLMEQ